MTYMNDATIDKLLGMYSDLEHKIDTNGFSDLDLKRLVKLSDRIELLISKMKKEMESD